VRYLREKTANDVVAALSINCCTRRDVVFIENIARRRDVVVFNGARLPAAGRVACRTRSKKRIEKGRVLCRARRFSRESHFHRVIHKLERSWLYHARNVTATEKYVRPRLSIDICRPDGSARWQIRRRSCSHGPCRRIRSSDPVTTEPVLE